MIGTPKSITIDGKTFPINADSKITEIQNVESELPERFRNMAGQFMQITVEENGKFYGIRGIVTNIKEVNK